eukprot:TRINITY_DN1130_c0_g1_i5.p1 TRINITY_DN1130_c0_g1~~TRINITY_DN1130_c0_g1_i5.p1  ORF type:complete len:526 (-),score=100.17 TRINITY_DN1130_c0_g1_i5:78-1655(-)
MPVAGMKVRVWDKHRIRKNKFMGQIVIKFNLELLASDPIKSWFTLESRRAKEEISGEIKLNITFGHLNSGRPSLPKQPSVKALMQSRQVQHSDWNNDKVRREIQHKSVVLVSLSKEDAASDGDSDEPRDGPQEPYLEALADEKSACQLTSPTQARHLGTEQQAVRANVFLRSGKWFYEVVVTSSGFLGVGIATKNYLPEKSGDAWVWDGDRLLQVGYDAIPTNVETSQRSIFTAGETIGVGIDLDRREVAYFRNGSYSPPAFQLLPVDQRICPFVLLCQGSAIRLVFGKNGSDDFQHLQPGYLPLTSKLEPDRKPQLLELFNRYKDKRNGDGEESDSNDNDNDQMRPQIGEEGFKRLLQDVGAKDWKPRGEDGLILSWKLLCELAGTITYEEFLSGFSAEGCSNLAQISKHLNCWQEEILTEKGFRLYAFYLFNLFRQRKNYLPKDDFVSTTKLLLGQIKWPLLQQWSDYLQKIKLPDVDDVVWERFVEIVFSSQKPKQEKRSDLFAEFVESHSDLMKNSPSPDQ